VVSRAIWSALRLSALALAARLSWLWRAWRPLSMGEWRIVCEL
jgi:hypothetical protein